MIKFSAPGKVHLLGEHAVVYGKPALLVTVNLRVIVILSPSSSLRDHKVAKQSCLEYNPTQIASLPTVVRNDILKKIIEPIVKRYLKIKTIPSYQLEVASELPIGAGLGSSAAISAAYIAALLTFLKVKWDKTLVNELTYQAEKVFHGNPSGADNRTVIFGGITVPSKLASNFVFINTGTPAESTKKMVELVGVKREAERVKFGKIFDNQEQLVKELLPVLEDSNEKEFIKIIRAGEKNLESLGVVSPFAKSIIRKIEKIGGAAKICGGGGKTKEVGVLLAYHPKPISIKSIAQEENLPYFSTTLGVEGLRQEAS